jgi:hypothetical protein
MPARDTGLKKDGELDMRTKLGRQAAAPQAARGEEAAWSAASTPQKELRTVAASPRTAPARVSACLDLRKPDGSESGLDSSYCGGGGRGAHPTPSIAVSPSGPLKTNGNPDLRYKENRTARDTDSAPAPARVQTYDGVGSYAAGGDGSSLSSGGGSSGTFYKGGQFMPGGGRAPKGGCHGDSHSKSHVASGSSGSRGDYCSGISGSGGGSSNRGGSSSYGGGGGGTYSSAGSSYGGSSSYPSGGGGSYGGSGSGSYSSAGGGSYGGGKGGTYSSAGGGAGGSYGGSYSSYGSGGGGGSGNYSAGCSSGGGSTGSGTFYKGGQFMPGGGRAPKGGCYG